MKQESMRRNSDLEADLGVCLVDALHLGDLVLRHPDEPPGPLRRRARNLFRDAPFDLLALRVLRDNLILISNNYHLTI